MKENEMNILEVLSKASNLSQRHIAKKTGMSLGMVNTVIKRCVKKGLIKIEGLNPRSVRYILTPKGIEEKAKKTLEYVSKSYKAIQLINNYIQQVTEEQIKKGKTIIVLGSNDEMKAIIMQTLKDMDVEFKVGGNIKTIKNNKDNMVYIWQSIYENKLKEQELKYINLVK